MSLPKLNLKDLAIGLALFSVMAAIGFTQFGREHGGLIALLVYPFCVGWFGWRIYRWQKHGEPIDEIQSTYSRWYGETQWALHLWLIFAVSVLAYPVFLLLYFTGHFGS